MQNKRDSKRPKHETSEVNVVQPAFIKFQLKNYQTLTSTWILETEKFYEIEIFAFTIDHKQIYASDDIKFDTFVDSNYFNILKSSQNGSYFHFYAKKSGITQTRSSLDGILDESGKKFVYKFVDSLKIVGKQEIELLNGIKINPELLIFAWKSSPSTGLNYEYQLEATGGSGLYNWQSKNTSILTVSSNGYIKMNQKYLIPEGAESQVFVYDQKNANIQAFSRVLLLEPIELNILKCPIETNVNKSLNIKIQMFAIHNGDKVLITDCSKLNFKIWLQNENVFKLIKIDSPTDSSSCAIISLQSINEGQTLIRVSYEAIESEQIIHSFTNLKSTKNFYLLNHLSSYLVKLAGGLLLHQQKLNENIIIENASIIDLIKVYDSKTKQDNYKIVCKETDGETKIKIEISSSASNDNEYCPLKFEYDFTVKCDRPYKLELNQLLVNKSKLSFLRECPFKSNQQSSSGKFILLLFKNWLLKTPSQMLI